MTKVYLLNQPRNNATFLIYGDGGNMVRYTFKDGNSNANQPATCVLRNEYYQNLLEGSEYFAKGVIKLDPTFKDVAVVTPKKKLTAVNDVKSVAQAVEYCAEHFGEVVKNTKQAKECAEKHGYDFVNLKVKD